MDTFHLNEIDVPIPDSNPLQVRPIGRAIETQSCSISSECQNANLVAYFDARASFINLRRFNKPVF